MACIWGIVRRVYYAHQSLCAGHRHVCICAMGLSLAIRGLSLCGVARSPEISHSEPAKSCFGRELFLLKIISLRLDIWWVSLLCRESFLNMGSYHEQWGVENHVRWVTKYTRNINLHCCWWSITDWNKNVHDMGPMWNLCYYTDTFLQEACVCYVLMQQIELSCMQGPVSL